MEITILLISHNEEVMLPHTYNYYKKRFPKAKFVLCSTNNTDNTHILAKERGFEIKTFPQSVGDRYEHQLLHPKNTYWKPYKGWVIIADMDEWLDMDEKMLKEEDDLGTTIITTSGMQMYHDSKKIDLSDIKSIEDEVVLGHYHMGYCKSICFKNGPITDINFQCGAHHAKPVGNVVKSKKTYYLRHYCILGQKYFDNKIRVRIKNREGSVSQGVLDKEWAFVNKQKREGNAKNVKHLFRT